MKALFAIALFCAALLPHPAHAFRVSLVGVGNQSSIESSSATYNSKISFGGGALAEFRLVPTLGIEFGFLAVPRKYESSLGGYPFDVSQSTYQIPVLIRAHLLNLFSLGVGGYYTKYSGDITYSNKNSASSYTYPSSYSAAGFSESDYGLVTSLGLYYSLVPGTRILFDARYLIGSKNNDESGSEKKFRDIQLLLGIQFGI